jgi:RNA polymerase sigma factor (sigma-70 family)
MASATLTAALRQIHTLFSEGAARDQGDAQLLERFVSRGDALAFEILMARHGPMVMAVCRGVLDDPSDAEDALQATFLVMIRKADAIRGRAALGCWLHRVAYRVAIHTNREGSRRRAAERRAATIRPVIDHDRRSALHEEVARLPERLRRPVVLCYLEGKTHGQAATELRWGEATVRRRLAGARDLLRSRLSRRGVVVSAGALASMIARESSAAIPEAWASAMIRAGTGHLVGRSVGPAVAALATRAVGRMLPTRLKAATALALATVAVGWVSAGFGTIRPAGAQGPPQAMPVPAKTPPRQDASKKSAAPVRAVDGQPANPLAALLARLRGGQTFEYKGQVVDPAGRPFAGAKLFVLDDMLKPGGAPRTPRATSGPDGRFRFTVPADGARAGSNSRVVAAADGFGLSLLDETEPDNHNREITIKLAEEMPIEGRIVDLEGRPVVAASIAVEAVWAPPGDDLAPWLKAIEVKEATADELKHRYLKTWLPYGSKPFPPARTDAEGRFLLRGIGRGRMVELRIEAPTIRTTEVTVLTRRGEPIRVQMHPLLPQFGSISYHDASPRLVATPSRPLEGIVRDKKTRAPIGGVILRSYKFADGQSYNDGILETSSDALGHFRMIGMPRGSGNELLASPGVGYLPSLIKVEDPPGLGPIRLDIELSRGVTIEGKIVDKKGGTMIFGAVSYHAAADNPALDAAPGFRQIGGGGEATKVQIGPEGCYQVTAIPGRGVLVVQAYQLSYPSTYRDEYDMGYVPAVPMFYQALVKLDIPQDAVTLKQDITLDPGRTLEGTVLDTDGKPLNGASIYGLQNLGSWSGMGTDVSTFRIMGFETASSPAKTPRTLLFRHEGRKLAGWLDLKGDEPGPLRVRLEPWGVIVGRIVDPEGRPQADITLRVDVADRKRLGGGNIEHPDRVRTDAGGRFVIDGVAPGRPYRIDVQAPTGQRGMSRIDVAAARSGQSSDLGDLKIVFRDRGE